MKTVFFLAACATFFTFLSLSGVQAAIALEYYTYTAYSQPGQPANFVFQLKNTAAEQATATIFGIDVQDEITWASNSGTLTFSPGESKAIVLDAVRGKQAKKLVDSFLFISLSPNDPEAPRTIPLFIVFADPTTTQPVPPQQNIPPVNATHTSPTNGSISPLSQSFCSTGAKGTNLSITDVNIESNGDDDEEWNLLDEIAVVVEVKNIGASDLEEGVVELGLIDSAGRNVAGKLDFLNDGEEKIELGELDKGDDDELTFRFRVAADLDDGKYKLTLKAYDKKSGENKVCTDTAEDFDNKKFQTIDIEREDNKGKFIAFQDVRVTPIDAVCGDTVTLSARAVNIGDEDQDRVRVLLKGADLKLDAVQELRSGLDKGDDEYALFAFIVPQGLADKTYALDLSAEYDYRNGVYREKLDTPHRVPLKVVGCAARYGTGEPDIKSIVLRTAPTPQNTTSLTSSSQAETGSISLPVISWVLIAAIVVLVILIVVVALVQGIRRPRRLASPSHSGHAGKRGKNVPL